MPDCNNKVLKWILLVMLPLSLFIYLYIYSNDGSMKTSTVPRVMQRDLQVGLNDKSGYISFYSKLKRYIDKPFHIAVSDVETVNTTRKYITFTQAPAEKTQTAPGSAETSIDHVVESLKKKILKHESQPLLTLFTTWADNADKYLVHNLTISNWVSLRPFVIPAVFTNETAAAESCRSMGFKVFPISHTAADGIPVLKYMYKDVMDTFNTSFYAYSNSDILFTDTIVKTIAVLMESILDMSRPALIVGKRTNIDNVTEEEGSSWENITRIAKSRGKLFKGYAEDFFITPRAYQWMDMPDVVIGRRAYDNWLVYHSRKLKHTVIDTTETLLAVHQTTTAGNYESHSPKKRNSYNRKLLLKLYKIIKYSAGAVDCIEQCTKFENNRIVVRSRVRHVRTGCDI